MPALSLLRMYTPAEVPFQVFEPGQADVFLDQYLKGSLPESPRLPMEDALGAAVSVGMMVARARAALTLWAVPQFSSDQAELLELPQGANPFRIEACLLELLRQGRLGGMAEVGVWRRALQAQMTRGLEGAGQATNGSALLHLVRQLSLPDVILLASPKGDGTHGVQFASGLKVVMGAAAGIRAHGAESREEEVPPAWACQEAQAVVARELDAHMACQPLVHQALTPEDLLSLASSPHEQVRALGVVLASEVGAT